MRRCSVLTGIAFLVGVLSISGVAMAASNVNESPAVATLFGETVTATDPAELQRTILSALFDEYAREHEIKADDFEIDAFVDSLRRGMAEHGLTAENELTPDEAAELQVARREMARSIIRQWKINRSLYREYGGRIIYQQLGPEPLDAYRKFLEDRSAQGAFVIHDEALAKDFWLYFTDESKHDFMEPGGADEQRAFSSPPWEGLE